MKNTIKVNTWLPVFPGFYGSYFDFDHMTGGDMESTLFDNHTAIHKEVLDYVCSELVWDNTDNSDYENDVCKACTEFIDKISKEIFPNIIKSITYENVSHPKEYNFKNDSINCIVELDFDLLLKTFANHPQASDYLKDTYTSRSGFISHYPNNMSAWITDALDDQQHTVGSMLDFLLSVDDESKTDSDHIVSVDDMYDYISDDIFASNYINYDNMLQAINDKYEYSEDLTEWNQLEGFIPVKGGNHFMQLLTGIGYMERDPEDIPETEFFAADGLLNTMLF